VFDNVNVIQEQNAGGTVTANMLVGLGVDDTIRRSDSVGSRDLLSDVLGNTIELADTSGNLQTHYSFEPFGVTAVSGSTSANSVQFTGRELDSTGLYYLRARYYNPRLQRFIAEDPLGFGGGDTNLYGYVGNRPTIFTDPFGLQMYNRSPAPWWVKPENDDKPVTCVPPGGRYDGPIDGGASPFSQRPGEVFKNPTGTLLVIAPNGSPHAYLAYPLVIGTPFGTIVAGALPMPVNWHPGYGWQRPGFTTDPAWGPLFRNSAPAPDNTRKPPKECPKVK
jgi:RHS repeat-associated protein